MNVPLTPIRCLYRAVDLYGNKVGVVSGLNSFTYAQFGERCERLAAGFLSEGIRPGDRVAYLSFNTHQLLEGYYGPPLVRAIVIPLNVRLQPRELVDILNHAGASMLVFENEFACLIPDLRKACPAIKQYIAIDQPIPQADLYLEELLARDRIPRPEIFSFDETEIAELFYTSGSTGIPKGVMLSHRTLYLHALGLLASIPCDDTRVELHTIPLFHANGWGRPQSITMSGGKHVMVRRFDPVGVLRLIQDEKATGMTLVPTMANALLNCPEVGKFDISSMNVITMGGAASSPELIARLEQVFHCDVGSVYGLTDGWLHTGDMAVWDGENYIYIVDRKKDIIISGGENISSIEVEKAIFAHPAVLECAVVSAPDPQWGEIPVAIVVVKPGLHLDQEQLLSFLKSRIAKFK